MSLAVVLGVALLPLRLAAVVASSLFFRFMFRFFPVKTKSMLRGNILKSSGGMPPKASLAAALEEDPDFGRGFLATTERLRMSYKILVDDAFRHIRVGARVPDLLLTDLASGSAFKFPSELPLANRHLPLVINFGSCTWPPFMGHLERFSQLVESFSDVANFVVVYIAEAHPQERHHFRGNYAIATPRRLEDRMSAAATLKAEMQVLAVERPQMAQVPILVDQMDDAAAAQYAALPERLYILEGGVVAYEGGVGPFGYKMEEVANWLDKMK